MQTVSWCGKGARRLLGKRSALTRLPHVGTRWMGLVTRNWEHKRFYRHVSVYKAEEEGLYGVQLDHKHLRTPLRKLFLLPSYPLALAVSQEWADQEDNPIHGPKAESVSMLANYLHSDTLCSRVTEPYTLVQLQEKDWDPVLTWFNNRFNVDVQCYTSIIPPAVQPCTLGPVMTFMSQLNRWAFAGFELCVESSKSLILACAMFEGELSVKEAADLARLEVKFQTSRWGEVEWQHTVDESDLKARLTAGLIMKQLSNNA